MWSTLSSLLLSGAVFDSFGCAGTDFVRPDPETPKNGQTTYAQVLAMMGEPRSEGSVIKNEKTVKTISYAYARARVTGTPLHTGVTPARGMGFYFYNDTLVGHEFVSSWAEDNTDFDETKIKDIIKGKTTRVEVTQLLGKPSGYYSYPLIKFSTGQAAVYVFTETRKVPFRIKFFRKVLIVTFDTAGVVTDVEFTSLGRKWQHAKLTPRSTRKFAGTAHAD